MPIQYSQGGLSAHLLLLAPMPRLSLPLVVLSSWLWLALPSAAQTTIGNPIDLAQTHWYAGRQQQALDVLTQAIASDPQQRRWRFTLAWMRQDRGETPEAEALLRRLVEDFPDYAEAHNNLAVIQAGRGDLDDAQQSLARAVLLNPDHAQAQENLGDVLIRLAQRAYNKAQGLQPQARLQLKISQLDALVRAR